MCDVSDSSHDMQQKCKEVDLWNDGVYINHSDKTNDNTFEKL